MKTFIYPDNLYSKVRNRWKIQKHQNEEIPPLPDQYTFQQLIDVVYHVSFLTEESRRTWFRVIYISQKEVEEIDKIRLRYVKTIKFDKPRNFNISELLKLAPAADPTQVLIGVIPKHGKSKNLEIWGLIDYGLSWWDYTRNESYEGSPPPNAFTLSAKRPGQITISREGEVILILDQGKIVGPFSKVLYKGHVAQFLDKGVVALGQKVNESFKDTKTEFDITDDWYKWEYKLFLERVIIRVREKFHGGTIVIVPDELHINDTRLTDRINIKYTCNCNSAWESLLDEAINTRKYYDLDSKLNEQKQITQKELLKLQIAKEMLDTAVEKTKYTAGFFASLAAVDGAIVMSNKLRLLGFGAEIIASSTSLKKIKIVSDFEKNSSTEQNIDLFGTRHRSAIRFCSSLEDSIVIIISQDGEIRIAKRVGSDVMLWPNINIGLRGF